MNQLYEFLPYESSFTGGVRVAQGDVNGDGIADIITGPGAGRAAEVKVYSGFDRSLLYSFNAFPNFTGGVNVAAGDVNGDGHDDIIIGMDSGGSTVAVYSGADGSLLRQFTAFASSPTGGVRLAAGDVNGDGRADIIVGSGPGGPAGVGVYNGTDNSIILGFLAFDVSFLGGVYVSAGDIDGDGIADIIVGAGTGRTPEVRVFSGQTGSQLSSFLAYDSSFVGGVRVAARDIDGDGIADILTGTGAGSSPDLRLFNGLTLTEIDHYFAYDPQFTGGFFVA